VSLSRRIERLEATCENEEQPGFHVVDWDATGIEIDGRFLTFEEYEQEYPDRPKVIRWPLKEEP
jgi:hypothetical protein